MIPFGVAHELGRQKGPPSLKSVTHILQRWNMAHLYITKEDPKIIWIMWHTPWVLLTSNLYKETYRCRLHFDT